MKKNTNPKMKKKNIGQSNYLKCKSQPCMEEKRRPPQKKKKINLPEKSGAFGKGKKSVCFTV